MKKLLLFIIVFQLTNVSVNAQDKNTNLRIAGIDYSQVFEKSFEKKSSVFLCDTVSSFIAKPNPAGLASDGVNLWHVDDIYIYKTNTIGAYLDSIPNPSTNFIKTGGLTHDGVNLWFAAEQEAALFKINPSTGTVLQQFDLPSAGEPDPNGYGVAWDGTNIWHSQYIPPMIFKLDPTNGNVLDSFPTEKGILSLEWVNGELFGINRGDEEIFNISTLNGNFLASGQWCIPSPIGLTWDGSSLWNVSGPIQHNGYLRVCNLNADLNLSIDEHINKNNLIKVYPNPTSSKLNISWDEQTLNEINLITILNVSGVIVKTINQSVNSLDISNLPSGIYFINFKTDIGTISKKLVKQ